MPVEPRPAASVVLVRRADPLEVLLVRRRGGGTFGDLVVFPGGTVEPDDREYGALHPAPDGAQRAAVLRELAEETGLLVLEDEVVPVGHATGVYDWLRAERRDLGLESLTMVSRWVTPPVMPYRFDTWFYVLAVAGVPEVVVDGDEVVGYVWARPEEALVHAEQGRWQMILPTLAHLRWLSRRSSVDDVVASARGADGRTLITPEVREDGSMVPIHMPADGR